MILVMATVINLLLRPATSLQPILVTQHFGGAAFELAWMESAWGIGAVVGGLLLSAWGGFRRRVVTSLLALVMLGAGMTAIGFVPASAFWLAVGLMFLVGVTGPLIDGPLFAVVQTIVAPEMQGRVFTLMISAASAMSPLGLIVAGPLADTFGVQTWYVVGGMVTGLMGLIAFFIPAIVRIEDGRPTNNQAVTAQQLEPASRLAAQPTESIGD
jgi:DHA3 family macrolide efflux protein-like MFS transporter